MRRFGLAATMCLALVTASCRTKDVRTVLIYVPEMRNIACSEIVVRAVSRCIGVVTSKVEVDLSRRTVTVSYDSLVTALKNLEFAIAEAGFQANEIPAKEDAARNLPPECRGAEKN